MHQTRAERAEEAWHACGALEFRGERLFWSKAHDRLFRLIHHNGAFDPETMTAAFVWVAALEPAVALANLRKWFANRDRAKMIEAAAMVDLGDGFEEAQELAEKLFALVDASGSEQVPEGGNAPPGKSPATSSISPT